jgi:hypothetical protein
MIPSPGGPENAGYDGLAACLRELRDAYKKRKEEIRGILAETGALKKETAVVLKKANRLTRHLTGRQRRETGVFYHSGFFDFRAGKDLSPVPGFTVDLETEPELLGKSPEKTGPGEIKTLCLIDRFRKELLALDLLEMRCRELLLSMNKALEAFRHEYSLIRRRIYPFMLFSALYKRLRCLRGLSYFSPGDLREIAALGELTGHVMKIVCPAG